MRDECAVLMDACTPLVYRRNSFRITGLAVDASPRTIRRRVDDFRHAEEHGDADQEHGHAFALIPPPDLEQIREAALRLQDPERRLIEEFFWFWPTEWNNVDGDAALAAISRGEKGKAVEIWIDGLGVGHNVKVVVAKHNLAVMYQMLALDHEYVALDTDLSEEGLTKISEYWRECFRFWEELTEDETFWSFLADRIRMLNEPQLTTGFARRMRKSLPGAMDKINAMLAIMFFESGKLERAERQIIYMQDTHRGLDNVPETLARITQPLKTRVQSAAQNATGAASREPESAANIAREMLLAVAEPLRVIKLILPVGNHERVDLCDSVAEACIKCQLAYARETEDWTVSLEILDGALAIAASTDMVNRISENRTIVSSNRLWGRHVEPLLAKLKALELRPIASRVTAIRADVLPHLRTIKESPGMTTEIYERCADLVAGFVRGLALSANNKDGDLAAATGILELAIATARGGELIAQLQGDKKQLARIKTQLDRTKARGIMELLLANWKITLMVIAIVISLLNAVYNPNQKKFAIDLGGRTYVCSGEIFNRAMALRPSDADTLALESRKRALEAEDTKLSARVVDRTSKTSVDQYNMALGSYLFKAQRFDVDVDAYNDRVDAYRGYVQANCSPQ